MFEDGWVIILIFIIISVILRLLMRYSISLFLYFGDCLMLISFCDDNKISLVTLRFLD